MMATVEVRMDDRRFMGVVQAISREVEKEQRLERGELLGACYVHCKKLLDQFDPSMCSSFARYAYMNAKLSLTRDVTRERRSLKGLRYDGTERDHRHAEPDFHEDELAPGERPSWWRFLTQRERSITLLLSQGAPLGQIARCMETDIAGVTAELARAKRMLMRKFVSASDMAILDPPEPDIDLEMED